MLPTEPKVKADNAYRDLDYSRCHKKLNQSHIVLKKITTHRRTEHSLTLLLEIMHCARKLQTSQLSASRELTNL